MKIVYVCGCTFFLFGSCCLNRSEYKCFMKCRQTIPFSIDILYLIYLSGLGPENVLCGNFFLVWENCAFKINDNFGVFFYYRFWFWLRRRRCTAKQSKWLKLMMVAECLVYVKYCQCSQWNGVELHVLFVSVVGEVKVEKCPGLIHSNLVEPTKH